MSVDEKEKTQTTSHRTYSCVRRLPRIARLTSPPSSASFRKDGDIKDFIRRLKASFKKDVLNHSAVLSKKSDAGTSPYVGSCSLHLLEP